LPLLSGSLPVELLLVRVFEVERAAVESVSATTRTIGRSPPPVRNDLSPEQMEQLLEWCRHGAVLHASAEGTRRELPGMIPDRIAGQVLAGPLNGPEGPLGMLIATTTAGRTFKEEHERLFEVLLEPFTVALENDRRLRELVALRERAEADNRSLLSRLGRNDLSDAIVGAETGLRHVMERVELVARADIPVLLLGETGSGKEVIARAIHRQSRRNGGPFLRVNCGAIPPELVDSELFGHEKGSFTGATALRKGWFERADGGTLFLDECGELTPAVQVRLLRILQDGTFERVGGEKPQHVDVRVVAATHQDLQKMVRESRFREDLWYRLAVFTILLPSLRERIEDIPLMAAHFALRAARRFGLTPCAPTPDDINLLVRYAWPGNVRELVSVIERAAILGDGRFLDVAAALGAAPPAMRDKPIAPHTPQPLEHASIDARPRTTSSLATLDEAASTHIISALQQTRGRIEGPSGAARLLNINPHTLRARMRKLKIEWKQFRKRD